MGERIGGTDVTLAEILPMRKALDDCQLQEGKMIGSYFTWNNKQDDGTRVYSKIDRVLINDAWLQRFPDSVAQFLPEGHFDHCPCVIQFNRTSAWKKAPFKYFNIWALADNFDEVVQHRWQEDIDGSPMFRNFQEQLRHDPLNNEMCKAERACAQELMGLRKAREMYLAQKAKESWVKDGDSNTSFFH
ncbi:uncharacterized protein LOC141631817 [Silene latifolia]|uniref:uncharacterized protein LOC141631817 n=1 Tax=Silene latifolia TaxID=37657 RepID=UPI003D784818